MGLFDDVYLVDSERTLIDSAEIDQLESQLGLKLPAGYREFLTSLGQGTFCDLVWTIPPLDFIEMHSIAVQTWEEYDFWEAGSHILSKEQILSSFLIAQSADGDQIILNPDRPKHLYVLPRQDDSIYWLDASFADPLAWDSENGQVNLEPPFRYFEPTNENRKHIELFTARTDHRLEDIISRVSEFLATDGVIKSISESDELSSCEVRFTPAIAGRLQFTTAYDGRIGIRIGYNQQFHLAVKGCINDLGTLDFYVIGGDS